MKSSHYLHNNHCSCGKIITDYRKFCKKCSHKGIRCYNFKDGLPKCTICKKELTNYDAKLCHSCENKRRYKMGIMNNKGENNGQFIHGMKKRKYPKEFSKELKYKILKRDNYTCQKCNKYPTRLLSVHHIDYNKFNNTKNNLITLCRSCNSKVNKKTDYWYAYFTYLMEDLC